jgi:signal recognition particle GTPase
VITQQKSRRRRIAVGSGRTESEVDALLQQFQMMKRMMSGLGGMGMFGRMAPAPAFAAPKFDSNRKDKRKREKLARKKNKRR